MFSNNTQPVHKNSPLEQEVPAQFLQLLQSLRNKIKENSEHASKLESNVLESTNTLTEPLVNAGYFLKNVKSNSSVVFADAKDLVSKVTNEVCNCKTLIEIEKQKKLHPSQASNQLGNLLIKIGTNLHAKIDKLNDKVYELEHPLREYIAWKEDGTQSQKVGKQELMEHVDRIVMICNVAFMNSVNLKNKVEQLKVMFTIQMRQLYGRHLKSPFKSLEEDDSKKSDFEYDAQRGIKMPNIFPSTTALLSLVGSIQRPLGQQSTLGFGQQPTLGFGQQQSTLGFSQQQPASSSIFGFSQQPRPAPFSLGQTNATSTAGLGGTTSLFNKPLTAPISTLQTSTPSLFGSNPTSLPQSNAPSLFGPTPTSLPQSNTPSLFGPTQTSLPQSNAPNLFGSTANNTSKPAAFQLPTINTSMPSFGSTLNSSSGGTLFGGSATRPSLFGAK